MFYPRKGKLFGYRKNKGISIGMDGLEGNKLNGQGINHEKNITVSTVSLVGGVTMAA